MDTEQKELLLAEVKDLMKEELELTSAATDIVWLKQNNQIQKQFMSHLALLRKQMQCVQVLMRRMLIEKYIDKHFNATHTDTGCEQLERSFYKTKIDDSALVMGLGVQIGKKVENVDEQREGNECSERTDVCKARCCKFPFALTKEEVLSGKILWSTERPFLLEQDEDGYCKHLDRNTFECTIYEERPSICRTYSCVNDKRIWSNYQQKQVAAYNCNKTLSRKDRG